MNLLANRLHQGLQALQLHFPESTQTQFLHYLELLEKWNRVYNLTGVRDIIQMIPKHVLDSLAVLPYIHGTQILDVGTGAGLPGLILAIARPEWQYVLLDSNAKKIRFVRQAIIELKLKNAYPICTRIETFHPSLFELNPLKEKFNTIISRAYTNLYRFYTQTIHLLTPEGYLLAMKGTYPKTEIAQMAGLALHLESFALYVPQNQAQRHLIVISPL